jgi:DNA-binding transcriptional regulator YiaG
MPNIGNILKQEIIRLARKTAKPEIDKLKHDIAELKRYVTEQAKLIKKLETEVTTPADAKAPVVATDEAPGTIKRLGPKLIRAQRKRLGLSQREFALLLGVSTNTLVLWESGKTAPREKVRAQFAAIREMGRREANQKLQGLTK